MVVDRSKAKQLMMCSMYWGLDMVASLKELLEDEAIRCDKEFNAIFGRKAMKLLIGTRNVTFVEYARICEIVIEELEYLKEHDANLMTTNMEALSFFTNQIVKLAKNAKELITLLGFADDAESMLNELGKELMGFKRERIKELA